MQVEIKVPQLPESVTEGTLGDWHKQVGDSVDVDENVVDLETDKVVLEIVASKAGVIESIAHESGDTVKSGDAHVHIGVVEAGQFAEGDTVTAESRQDSALLSVLARANALVVRPPNAPAAVAGETVDVIDL